MEFIVILFAVIQSVFGMGLLVFGTPTLILMGIPFSEALGWLLPASIAISAIQVIGERGRVRALWKGGMPILCMGPLILGLAIVLFFNFHAKIGFAIGLAMLVAAAIRLSSKLRGCISNFISRWEAVYLIAMGLLHGFTNMGGALLSVYAASMNKEKDLIRGNIYVYYLLFGIAQTLIIFMIKSSVFSTNSVVSLFVVEIVYGIGGRLIFHRVSLAIYERAITVFVASYGVAVIVKAGF